MWPLLTLQAALPCVVDALFLKDREFFPPALSASSCAFGGAALACMVAVLVRTALCPVPQPTHIVEFPLAPRVYRLRQCRPTLVHSYAPSYSGADKGCALVFGVWAPAELPPLPQRARRYPGPHRVLREMKLQAPR